jgi:hypothetical protein
MNNLIPFKGRTLNPDRKVRVHWNFHKKLYSVSQGGVVRAHANSLVLAGARFIVNQAGRQRVLRERRKNVHAWVEGYISEMQPLTVARQVKYNPLAGSTFMAVTGSVANARYVEMVEDSGHARMWGYGVNE